MYVLDDSKKFSILKKGNDPYYEPLSWFMISLHFLKYMICKFFSIINYYHNFYMTILDVQGHMK